ncbi:hypothetical protein JTB14_038282 [Gonioctena quinquepunctata]|nr:hypothetical protein JTB14_038282 [Gonioctena quinquepunctata]
MLWLPKHQQAFDQLKEVITKTPALVPFDPERQTVLQYDASKNGLACFSNMPSNDENMQNESKVICQTVFDNDELSVAPSDNKDIGENLRTLKKCVKNSECDFSVLVDIGKAAKLQRALKWAGFKRVRR